MDFRNPSDHYRYAAILTAFFPSIANADDIVFVPRAAAGYMNYELNTPAAEGIPYPAQSFDTSAFLIGIGATVFKERFFFDVFGQRTRRNLRLTEIQKRPERR